MHFQNKQRDEQHEKDLHFPYRRIFFFGEGVIGASQSREAWRKTWLFISGPTLNRLGVVGQCEEILTQAGIAVSTFCDTEGNHRWRLWNVQLKHS